MNDATVSLPGKRWRGKDAPTTLRRLGVAALLLIGGGLTIDAGWIHAKGALAQHLLQQAWEETRDGAAHTRPWPWADTHPVARLQAPRLGIDQIVLAGDSGRVLAFGPGWAEASSGPGTQGSVVISGHRDTHFAFLRELQPDDAVTIESAHGTRHYRVRDSRVADTRREQLAVDPAIDSLRLITCYPFDAVSAGGPLRYVVALQPTDAPT
jgi:sortase A